MPNIHVSGKEQVTVTPSIYLAHKLMESGYDADDVRMDAEESAVFLSHLGPVRDGFVNVCLDFAIRTFNKPNGERVKWV